MKHHVIYVPGLGDHKRQGQRFAPMWWQVFGVRGHYVPMHWNDGKPLGPKIKVLLDKIDELSADGSPVSLVGASAGASVVLVAFAARPDQIAGVVCICGKINHPETIHPERFVVNPAFKESLDKLQEVLPTFDAVTRQRIMSMHPLRDGSVPPADTIIPGARKKLILMSGHVFSIATALIFNAYGMMRFLKKQAKV